MKDETNQIPQNNKSYELHTIIDNKKQTNKQIQMTSKLQKRYLKQITMIPTEIKTNPFIFNTQILDALNNRIKVQVMYDSGANGCFMTRRLAEAHRFSISTNPTDSREITTIDNTKYQSNTKVYTTILNPESNYKQNITFQVIDLIMEPDIILGQTWQETLDQGTLTSSITHRQIHFKLNGKQHHISTSHTHTNTTQCNTTNVREMSYKKPYKILSNCLFKIKRQLTKLTSKGCFKPKEPPPKIHTIPPKPLTPDILTSTQMTEDGNKTNLEKGSGSTEEITSPATLTTKSVTSKPPSINQPNPPNKSATNLTTEQQDTKLPPQTKTTHKMDTENNQKIPKQGIQIDTSEDNEQDDILIQTDEIKINPITIDISENDEEPEPEQTNKINTEPTNTHKNVYVGIDKFITAQLNRSRGNSNATPDIM